MFSSWCVENNVNECGIKLSNEQSLWLKKSHQNHSPQTTTILHIKLLPIITSGEISE